MEEIIPVTPLGQDEPSVGFDANGELQFSEEGLKGFKELLNEGAQENAQTEEATPEKEPESAKTPDHPPIVKKKLKVDGQELEVTEDELIALGQQGADYTRKMQRLATERDAIAPYQALINQLKTDPGLSQHLAKYWQTQGPQGPTKPRFDDPIEELKWETKQETMAEMRLEMQQAFQQQITPLHRQAALNQVKQHVQQDSDYQEVHQSIIQMVQGMPPSIQKNMYLQLDQDPASYLEAFQAQKAKINAARLTAAPQQPAPASVQPTKATERAPILETSNSLPDESAVKAQRVKIDKAKATAMRSGSVEALQGYLEAGGFLEHLR